MNTPRHSEFVVIVETGDELFAYPHFTTNVASVLRQIATEVTHGIEGGQIKRDGRTVARFKYKPADDALPGWVNDLDNVDNAASPFTRFAINGHQIDLPNDMHPVFHTNDPGAYDCIMYRGCEIVTKDVERSPDVYTGPFFVFDGDGLIEVATLDDARSYIDENGVGQCK